ncbi:MAG: hypothetical protein QHG98_07540 [Methanothrix sp.]|jgi:hypothetical protein|uniref:hypothetical protein n=1 Tax=Methanothrix sp. TaxID=90426 RepID=UPI00247E4FD2|nr:hypothetical protein [Methanothrix sp.]
MEGMGSESGYWNTVKVLTYEGIVGEIPVLEIFFIWDCLLARPVDNKREKWPSGGSRAEGRF